MVMTIAHIKPLKLEGDELGGKCLGYISSKYLSIIQI